MKKADLRNTLIVIPVYNSGKHLEELFDRIRKSEVGGIRYNILCVDDGSVDNSYHIIKKNKINNISHNKNRGKGYALKAGLTYAKVNDYKFVVTIDSDLQHDPKYISHLLLAQNIDNADLVIGFRDFKMLGCGGAGRSSLRPYVHVGDSVDKMPFSRVISNTLTSSIVSSLSKRYIFDSQSGFRLYNLDLFDENEITTDRYQMETEILFNYINKNAIISHVEIPVIYKDEKSHISHLRDIGNFIKVIFKEL